MTMTLTMTRTPTNLGALVLGNEIHLVHQAEDARVLRASLQGLETRPIISQILLELETLDVEYIDQHLDA